jgi:periplasmic protein TonB
MKNQLLLTICMLLLPILCAAQEVNERYYKDASLKKEVSKEKANFVRAVTQHEEGSETTSVKNIGKNEIIRSQTYQGTEPVGVWVIQYIGGPRPIDYDFKLNYSEEQCSDSSGLILDDYFADNKSIGYVAPKISTGEQSFMQFLSKTVVYPAGALKEHIQGTVKVNFTITQDGSIEDIHVLEGKHILLDKEAMRVIRKLKLAGPPLLNGHAQEVCVSMPIRFAVR